MSKEAWNREVEHCMAQIQLRHQPSFSRLYDLTSSKLYGLVLKIVGNDATAADVLQESYLKIWQNAESYRPDIADAWAWICQLTRNSAIDSIRKQTRQREDLEAELPEGISKDVQQMWPDEVDLGRCLGAIKNEQKNVIISSYIYGLSHHELAETFQLPLGTLKSWIRRGLQDLKQCLEA